MSENNLEVAVRRMQEVEGKEGGEKTKAWHIPNSVSRVPFSLT